MQCVPGFARKVYIFRVKQRPYRLISFHGNDSVAANLPACVHTQALTTYFTSRNTCGSFVTPTVTISRPQATQVCRNAF